MKENTNEKSLVKINENSIFNKIKNFFKSLFHNNKSIYNNTVEETLNSISKDENRRTQFMEEIKNIEDKETLILKLQKQYRSGEIKEEDLSQEQVDALCELYDRQIANLKKSNEIRKQKLLEYRKNL